jgi:hypothetical protein
MTKTPTRQPGRMVWQVFRKFTDVNFPAYVQRQNLGCYPSKRECEHAIQQYQNKYPDSFVDGEVHYY